MFFDRRRYAGHLDSVTASEIAGWAWAGRLAPGPVDVEIVAGGRVLSTVRADRFRRDLAEAGIGGGEYGFVYDLAGGALAPGDNEIRVRVAGTRFELPGSPAVVRPAEPIEYFAGDIVDNCNLRCPFCLVDYENVRTTNRMTEETFRKWIAVMPLVRDGAFYISCLHEPTLHPRLFDFIGMIPDDLRRKVFFTTNLCKPLKDHQIEALARSRLHHVNVSMDTLDAELFEVLRKGGRLRIFMDNLSRLVAAFRASDAAPQLRYISMAYRSNLDELPGLVSRAFEELHAGRHEVRYTYNVRHIAQAFREQHFLSREDWRALEARLASLPHPIDVVTPPDDYDKTHARSVNYWEMPDEEGFPATVPDRPITLRGAWDGEVRLRKREQHFSVNVNILQDPAAFFAAL